MRTISAIAATIIAATLATSAHAAPPPPGKYQYINGSTGGTFGNDDPAARFQDTYVFTTYFPRIAAVLVTSDMASLPGRVCTGKPRDRGCDFSTNVNFVSNGVKLNGKVIPAISTGVKEVRFLSALANFRIPAGTQTIQVNGSSGLRGTYAGVLTLISDVPEPSTWALMIVGFGAAGGALRRRRDQGRAALATA